jgi:hypothetical protein
MAEAGVTPGVVCHCPALRGAHEHLLQIRCLWCDFAQIVSHPGVYAIPDHVTYPCRCRCQGSRLKVRAQSAARSLLG